MIAWILRKVGEGRGGNNGSAATLRETQRALNCTSSAFLLPLPYCNTVTSIAESHQRLKDWEAHSRLREHKKEEVLQRYVWESTLTDSSKRNEHKSLFHFLKFKILIQHWARNEGGRCYNVMFAQRSWRTGKSGPSSLPRASPTSFSHKRQTSARRQRCINTLCLVSSTFHTNYWHNVA